MESKLHDYPYKNVAKVAEKARFGNIFDIKINP